MESISIIVPMYNVEETIERCIESIIHTPAEIILVNDGSIDNTLKICEKYVKNNCNIKVVSQENKGLRIARYTGIQNATKEYIMFLDGDDFYEKNTIERMVETIEKYNRPDLIRFRYKLEYV